MRACLTSQEEGDRRKAGSCRPNKEDGWKQRDIIFAASLVFPVISIPLPRAFRHRIFQGLVENDRRMTLKFLKFATHLLEVPNSFPNISQLQLPHTIAHLPLPRTLNTLNLDTVASQTHTDHILSRPTATYLGLE